jgi:Fur family ferric uptake transcriptional regulator
VKEKSKNRAPDFKVVLKEAGFKATPGRLRLLEALWKESEPLTVLEIQKRLHNTLNEVTLYRALEAFAKAGLVRRADFGHDHAHYELAIGKAHHEHAVCTKCGVVEDIEGCTLVPLEKKALKQSNFKSIYSHNVEFFGLCKKCI